MITKISMAGMTAEQWEEQRMKSLGGSDAGAVLGLNPYKSRYSLWAEKVGKLIPPDISTKEAVRLGHDLEEYVAKRFTEATGKKVRRENHFLYNSEYPFAHALPDRMIVGEKAGLDGFQSYLSGTILKYIWRWRHKNGLEDLKKAERYLKWLISEVEQDG